MIEKTGNIWDEPCDWICVTTNGMLRSDGKAVMGAGIALQAKKKYKGIDVTLAKKLKERGNVVSLIAKDGKKLILSFPTKHHWKDKYDMDLIRKSALQLKFYFNEAKIKPIVAIPRPGCRNGGLLWENVRKVLAPILVEDNFIVMDN